MKAMALPVFEQEKIWRPQSISDKDDYRYQCEQARKNGDPLPPRPVCHRAVTDDITIDKLGDILSYTNRGTLVLKDELSEFFASMDTYGNRKGGRDRAAYLSAYNGGPRTIDRVTRGELYVENFSICICGGIQPAKIQEMQNSLQDDGLLERFNIFHTRPPVKGHDRPKEQDFLPGYLKLIERLYALKAGEAPVLYSDDAIRYQEQIEQIALDFATSTTFPPRLCSHAGKWKGQFARYALVLHAMECVENGTFTNIIEKETVAKVARLFETFLIPNAMLFFDGENVTNEPLEHAKWLAGWILSRSLTEVSRRDMQRSYRDVRNDPGALRKATKLLEDFGWIAPKKTVRNETTAWHVNPQVHVLFQARAVEEARRRDETRRYLETVFKTAN
jgi:hypothetical protein